MNLISGGFKKIQNERNFITQFIKFIIVGVFNTSITLSIIFILSFAFNFDYRISNAAGYLAGFINSFIWNKFWTFRSQGKWKVEFIKLCGAMCKGHAIATVDGEIACETDILFALGPVVQSEK